MTSRDLPDLARVIRFRPREDYLGSPIPSALVDEAAVEASAKRVRMLSETNLSPYAQRMAALAVRGRDLAPIRNGMLAAALESATPDPRDAVIVYALLWRSLEKLCFDPARGFADDLKPLPFEPAVTPAQTRPGTTDHFKRQVNTGPAGPNRHQVGAVLSGATGQTARLVGRRSYQGGDRDQVHAVDKRPTTRSQSGPGFGTRPSRVRSTPCSAAATMPSSGIPTTPVKAPSRMAAPMTASRSEAEPWTPNTVPRRSPSHGRRSAIRG